MILLFFFWCSISIAKGEYCTRYLSSRGKAYPCGNSSTEACGTLRDVLVNISCTDTNIEIESGTYSGPLNTNISLDQSIVASGYNIRFSATDGAVKFVGEGKSRLFLIKANSGLSKFTFNGISFIRGSDPHEGGCISIHVEASSQAMFVFEGSHFENCSVGSEGDGGALYFGSSVNSSLTIINSIFSHSTAKEGGAIYATGNINITNVSFVGNMAYSNGGALKWKKLDSLSGSDFIFSIEDSIFVNNVALLNGGAIDSELTSGMSKAVRLNFTANNASMGGALSCTSLNKINITLSDVVFVENNATDPCSADLYGNCSWLFSLCASKNQASGCSKCNEGVCVMRSGHAHCLSSHSSSECLCGPDSPPPLSITIIAVIAGVVGLSLVLIFLVCRGPCFSSSPSAGTYSRIK